MNLYPYITCTKAALVLRYFLGAILVLASFFADAQPLQFSWARSVGGSHQDNVLGYDGTTASGSMRIDSSGNVYEIIAGQSSSYTFGSFHFTNPGGSGANVAYFVKYNPQGIVLWAKSFPRYPASAGGGAAIPFSMFTTEKGHSFLLFGFRDSLRLGSVLAVDTSIHITARSNNGYCIAEYDENGNVLAITPHKAKQSSLISIYPLSSNRMLTLGFCPGQYRDTLDGWPVEKGYFLAVMDSVGKVVILKTLGYDTSVQLLSSASIAVGGHSIYLQPTFYRSYLYRTVLPIGDLGLYQNGSPLHALIKLDDMLNFQWSRPVNYTLGTPMSSDKDDNVYLSGIARVYPAPDTLLFDTSRVPLLSPPSSSNYIYHTIASVTSTGTLRWAQGFLESGNGITQAIFTDRLGSIYLTGRYVFFLIAGSDTLSDPSNIFIIKILKGGKVAWSQSTHLGGRLSATGIAEDGRGNVFLNGSYADPHFPVAFGHDTLICTSPVANFPLAGDVFTARLGSCSPASVLLSASGALSWCGADSVVLSAGTFRSYLWSTGDTTSRIVARVTGSYSVYGLDSMGCYGSSPAIRVTASPALTLRAEAATDVSCYGGSDGRIHIRALGGSSPYLYSFSPGVADTAHVAAGTYAVILTDSAGCTARDTAIVTQPLTPLAVVMDSVLSSSSAGNGRAIAVAFGATPPYSYLWSTDPMQTGDTASTLKPGWYTVTITDHNGCVKTDSVYIRLYSGIADRADDILSIYPNPAKENFFINTGSNEAKVDIYDAQGKMISEIDGSPGATIIHAGSWPAGEYQIIVSGKNTTATKKVIVCH